MASSPHASGSSSASWFASFKFGQPSPGGSATLAPATSTEINGRHARKASAASRSSGRSGRTVTAGAAGAAAGQDDSSSDEETANDDHAQTDVEALLWQAQMDIIGHNYRSALRKLDKAANLGSSQACLTLANLYSRGLAASSDSNVTHKLQADPSQAAHWYLKGLAIEVSKPSLRAPSIRKRAELAASDDEARQKARKARHDMARLNPDERDKAATFEAEAIETQTFEDAQAHRYANEPSSEEEAALFDQSINLETVADLAVGLTTLYRLGRIRPDRDQIWHEGYNLSQDAIRHASLYPVIQQAKDRPSARAKSKSRQPGPALLRSGSNQTKSSALPTSAKHRRSAQIHILYLLALASFASNLHHENPAIEADFSTRGRDDAAHWWRKCIEIGTQAGGAGSKLANDLLGKATRRLEILANENAVTVLPIKHASSNLAASQSPPNHVCRVLHQPHHLEHHLSPLSSPADLAEVDSASKMLGQAANQVSSSTIKQPNDLAVPLQPQHKRRSASFTLDNDEADTSMSRDSVSVTSLTQPAQRPQLSLRASTSRPILQPTLSNASITTLPPNFFSKQPIRSSTDLLGARWKVKHRLPTVELSEEQIGIPASPLLSRSGTASVFDLAALADDPSPMPTTFSRGTWPSRGLAKPRHGSFASLLSLGQTQEQNNGHKPASGPLQQLRRRASNFGSSLSLTSLSQTFDTVKGKFQDLPVNTAAGALEDALQRDQIAQFEREGWESEATEGTQSDHDEEAEDRQAVEIPSAALAVLAAKEGTEQRKQVAATTLAISLGKHTSSPRKDEMDKVLAALEAASQLNVKGSCSVCHRKGVNFPKCPKCGQTYCSRSCRISTDGGGDGRKHVCRVPQSPAPSYLSVDQTSTTPTPLNQKATPTQRGQWATTRA
ncbi:uncharacterized protein L969DRAFT_91429 [Mixia osmundae IAM 14324]|uniref:Uncharacterized protein n=1 Tax=Mixia osmundae (strain CBS 9802 / IAM 14324 / JCM 22182 / KY 12970) TaxID=764103 RepID=G7E3V6_MIXOS|nr:uncharacterized protein L969DRAFT_91429 [Mixia osmundae IAM 14324]KEI41961.1 hypothetical protein L969DRAFT_91429 [Mixia osmundae IAM 14324]GAA97516.1 hypothetical protein E5Q_04194 [Mixia osmundae IAM 14324]